MKAKQAIRVLKSSFAARTVPGVLLALLWGQAAPAQTWQGTDDFTSGISTANWTVYNNYVGQMTVEGANGHASFLVPVSTNTVQNAFIVWRGTPTSAEDWTVDILGHNTAFHPSCQLQFAVVNTEAWNRGAVEAFNVGMMNKLNDGGVGTSWWHYPGGWTQRTRFSTNITDFNFRLVYRAAVRTVEAWYTPTASGQGWIQLDAMAVNDFSPGMTATNTFSFAILGNTDYGPIPEGEIWADNFSLTNTTPPLITRQPVSRTNDVGTTVTFSVAATGAAPLAYQWQFNGTNLLNGGNISGVTTTNLTIAGVQLSDAGDYSVEVSNTHGSVASTVANLVVAMPPDITSQPAGQTNSYSATATFTVTANGTPPLAYRWRFGGTNLTDGSDVSGATTSNLTLAYAGLSRAGLYDVVITNSYGSVTSEIVRLTVLPYWYTTNNGTVTITAYACSGGMVTIPSTIDGLPVTSIGDSVFYGCGLSGITIPASVTNIGDRTFAASGLTEIVIGDSITRIGSQAFRACPWLTSVRIGNGLSCVESYSFDSCTNLTNVVIGNSVTSIRDRAFSTCSSLASIILPNSVTNVGDGAFDLCTNLTSITMGNSITSIGNWTFGRCISLTAATLPNSVTSIGANAFDSCSSLASITIPSSTINIGGGAFSSCASLASIMIPDNVTSLGGRAFYSCTGLTNVLVGNNVTSIGNETFSGCSKLANVTLGNSVVSIGNSAFQNCTSLVDITVPNRVTSIGDFAFFWCTSLARVMNSASVTSIGTWAFGSCPVLSGVFFLGNAPSLGAYAFYGANNAIIYYVLGTTGWGTTFGGRPTALWNPPPLTLPGLYLTNAVLLADGRAQLEVVVPSNGVYTLLRSTDFKKWEPAMLLDSPTNRFVITSPRPISEIGNVFLRVVVGHFTTYDLLFYFVGFPATLVPGAPSISFPQAVDMYHVRLDVENAATWPDQSQVLFTGPPGTGMTNLAAFDASVQPGENSAWYMSPPIGSPPTPAPGTWAVNFGGTPLTFTPPDPQAVSRYLVPQPNLVVSNGMLTEVSWVYRQASDGQALATLPAYVQEIIVQMHGGTPVHRLYDSNGLPPDTTNHVVETPVPWSEISDFSISYYDDLGNCYDAHFRPFTRAALSTAGRPKTNCLSVHSNPATNRAGLRH